jgi:hypothetical protein
MGDNTDTSGGGDFYAGYDYSGDPALSTSVGLPTPVIGSNDAQYMLPGDLADNQHMAQWMPPAAQAQGMTWWQAAATMGLNRAIDNVFPGSPTGTMGNVYAGSAAGANGRTYSMRPIAAGGGIMSAKGTASITGNPLMLLLLVGAVILVLK